MNIEHVRLFVRLASTHNISMAGQELGLSPAVASSHINKLEERLGVRLVHRTTRKVSLTEEGQAFLPHAEAVLNSIEVAKASVGSGSVAPEGILRVTAPASFGRMHMMPALKGFMAKHPNLSVDFRFSDSIVDLVEGGFDVAIHNAALKDSTLVARKLAVDKRLLCASPEYIRKFGEPKHPSELNEHRCIILHGLENWQFSSADGPINIKPKGYFKSDNGEAVREASASGIGITINSAWSAYKHLNKGELVTILKDYPLITETSIWAVYPSSRLLAPKVRAFIEYFSDYYGDPPYWESHLKNI